MQLSAAFYYYKWTKKDFNLINNMITICIYNRPQKSFIHQWITSKMREREGTSSNKMKITCTLLQQKNGTLCSRSEFRFWNIISNFSLAKRFSCWIRKHILFYTSLRKWMECNLFRCAYFLLGAIWNGSFREHTTWSQDIWCNSCNGQGYSRWKFEYYLFDRIAENFN